MWMLCNRFNSQQCWSGPQTCVSFQRSHTTQMHIRWFDLYRCVCVHNNSIISSMVNAMASTGSSATKNSFRMNHTLVCWFAVSLEEMSSRSSFWFVSNFYAFIHSCEYKNSVEKIHHLTNISVKQTATILKHVLTIFPPTRTALF